MSEERVLRFRYRYEDVEPEMKKFRDLFVGTFFFSAQAWENDEDHPSIKCSGEDAMAPGKGVIWYPPNCLVVPVYWESQWVPVHPSQAKPIRLPYYDIPKGAYFTHTAPHSKIRFADHSVRVKTGESSHIFIDPQPSPHSKEAYFNSLAANELFYLLELVCDE